jgi:hypothetical protein
MRPLALCLMLLVFGACSHVQIDARSDSRPPVSTAGAAVHLHGGSLAALLLAGMLIAGAAEDIRNPSPVMQPDRAISEQDCTKPIELGDNLRCR